MQRGRSGWAFGRRAECGGGRVEGPGHWRSQWHANIALAEPVAHKHRTGGASGTPTTHTNIALAEPVAHGGSPLGSITKTTPLPSAARRTTALALGRRWVARARLLP